MLIYIITLGTSNGYAIAKTIEEATDIITLNKMKARYSTVSLNIEEVVEDEMVFLESLQRDMSTLRTLLNNEDNLAVVVTALSNRMHELEDTFNDDVANILKGVI